MNVIYNNKFEFKNEKYTGVGLGNFDGLHIGHMALINTLISESKLEGLNSLVYTFTKHPENILRKKLFTPLITTVEKKMNILEETALDYLYFDEFDEVFSRMKPEVFVREVLVKKLKIRLAVVGFDYRFGYKGQGDINLLKELGKTHNFKVIIIPPIKIDNEIVSSTSIRNYILKGKMDTVFKLLGRHYSITGSVATGKQIGRSLGFPTANIQPVNYIAMPYDGVYVTKTKVDNRLYNSITNIGKNPTFGDKDNVCVETHIIDFDSDIYNKNIEVFFFLRIRSEKKFKSKEELVEQIKKDINSAKEFFDTYKV